MNANTTQTAASAEDFIAAVGQELNARYRLDTQLLFAKPYARAAFASGLTPSEFVTWLAKADGLA